MTGAAMYAAERAEPMESIWLDATVKTLSIPYYTRDEKIRAEVRALEAKPELRPQERCLIQRVKSWPYDGKYADVPIQAFRIGNLAIVGLPAEIFVRLGLEIKHFSPADYTFVVELANARVSTYVPTTDQAERGAYGAKPILSRWLCSDGGRRMVDTAIVILHELWP